MALPSKNRRKQDSSDELAFAGPADTTIPFFPTPPQSLGSLGSASHGRRRRQLGEATGSEDEEFLTQEYRVGGPVLCAIPVRDNYLDPNLYPWYTSLSAIVTDILYKAQVPYEKWDLVKRGWIKSTEIDFLPTVYLIVKDPIANLDRWYNVFRSIRDATQRAGLPSINVDIADEKGLRYPRIFPIRPTDAIVAHWPILKFKILDELRGNTWKTVDVFKIGWATNADDNITTIQIIVSPNAYSDWDLITTRIVNLLDSPSHMLRDVQVKILRLQPGEDTDHFATVDLTERVRIALRDEPTLGGSMSVKNEAFTAGSLGGFLELQIEGTWHKLAVTCYHCVASEDLGLKDDDGNDRLTPDERIVMEKWNESGKLVYDNRLRIEVAQPALKDIKATIELFRENIDLETKGIAGFDAKEEILRDGGSLGFPAQDKRINDIIKYLSPFRERIQMMERFNSDLGHVCAASGFRSGETLPESTSKLPSTLDWALIHMNENRGKLAFNKIPPETEFQAFAQSRYKGNPEGMITETAQPLSNDLPAGSQLFKIGRMSGRTWGILNGISTLRLATEVKDQNGKVTEVKIVSEEYAIVSAAEMHKSHRFSEKGDSGSLIIDRTGRCAGLLFAGGEYRDHFRTLFIGIEELFADIKKMTGATDVRMFGNGNESKNA